MSEIRRIAAPTLKRKSSDFSIERILSNNDISTSSMASNNIKAGLPLQRQTSARFFDHTVALRSSSFLVHNKLDWLRNFYTLQLPNPRLQLDVSKSDKVIVKSIDTVKRFNNSDAGNINSKELSWIRCTRYQPPKLPKKSNSSKNLKRKSESRPRIPFTKNQLEILEDKYKKSAYLSRKDVVHMSDLLHIPQSRIKIWFQNRRARHRRESQILDQIQISKT